MKVKITKVPDGMNFGHALGSEVEVQHSVGEDWIGAGWAVGVSGGNPEPEKAKTKTETPDPAVNATGHVETAGSPGVADVVTDRAVRTRDATKKG